MADLDGDGDLETVVQAPIKELFRIIAMDRAGDPDFIQTRGEPVRLCSPDRDGLPEAIIHDMQLGTPWVAASIYPGSDLRIELVFVQGDPMGCVVDPAIDALTPHSVLIVCGPPYSGEADIDGDGRADIIWQDLPGSLAAAAPAGW